MKLGTSLIGLTLALTTGCAEKADDTAGASSELSAVAPVRGRAVCEVQYVSSANTTPAIDVAETGIGFDGAFPRIDGRVGEHLPFTGRALLAGVALEGRVTLTIVDATGAERGNIIVPASLAGLDANLVNYRNFGQLKVPVAPFVYNGETYDTVAAHCAVQL